MYRGLNLIGPAYDFSIIHQLFAGYYEEVEVALFERLATRSNVIIDIGANIGLYSCIGAANLPEGGHLIAFEPVPENVTYLHGNIARNGLVDKVTVEAAAVGDKTGSVTIYLARGIGHHSIGAGNALGWSSSTSVPLISLDSYLADHEIGPPDLIKVDAEGYDGFVLLGAQKTLSLHPTLLIEYSPHGLENCGFSPHEFLDIIFANYHHVFLVHEIRMRACTKQDVLRLGTKEGLGANLLATNDDSHLAIANMMLDEHSSRA
ncbi:hypothetical protein GCM10023196_099310 [Actinoallomurus vinaceus]|uniref:Methyltransferase FkbM domain-containing protein n=1 Tax=Actinoallomurus vinaceus TaxID=1080074 RepID=A0ABP8USP5_9ACTN